MRLQHALRVRPGDCLAFVGAGGKTTSIQQLVRELSGHLPLIITTTTHLSSDQLSMAQAHAQASDLGSLPTVLELAGQHPSVVVTGARTKSGDRWGSPPTELLELLFQAVRLIDGLMLVEADGARQRLIKAPARHEPVVPRFTTKVVPVVSAAALGKPLDSKSAHRVEELAEVLGVEPGQELAWEHIVRLYEHKSGLLKGAPVAAEVRALITSSSGGIAAEGRTSIRAILARSRVSAVLLGSPEADGPVMAAHGRVAGIVLAAGGSSRLGRSKQLLRVEGKSLVRRAVEAAVQAELDQVIVTLGAQAEQVREELRDLPLQFAPVPDWESGQSRSLRAGLGVLAQGIEAVVFLLADMPWVEVELVRALVERHSATLASIVAPRSEGRAGNPVLFDRRTYRELARVEGDQGGKPLFERFDVDYVEWDRRALIDIDRPEDMGLLDLDP